MAQLLVLESQDPERDITIYINSPGGSQTALTAIYDTMQYIKPQIQTVCLGQAASAAAVLLAAGSPGKRLALPNARVMIHQPRIEGGSRAQASDIEIYAEEILRMREWLEKTLAHHTGQTAEKVRDDIERDTFLSAEQAKEYGLVDQVLASPARAPGQRLRDVGERRESLVRRARVGSLEGRSSERAWVPTRPTEEGARHDSADG